MNQVHCRNCNSNRVNVATGELRLIFGIAVGIAGAVLLYLTIKHSSFYIVGALPTCLFSLYSIYRYQFDKNVKCVCRRCHHKFVYNLR